MISQLNLNYFIACLPPALAFALLFNSAEKTSFFAFVGLCLAELIRQYLSLISFENKPTPKKLFLFGAIYQNTEGFLFSKTKISELPLFANARVYGYVVLFVFSLVCMLFLQSQIAYLFYFGIHTFLWTQANNFKQLRALLCLNILNTAILYAFSSIEINTLFFAWLALSLYVLQLSFVWENGNKTPAKFRIALASAILIVMIYKTFDTLLPDYRNDPSTQTAEVESDEEIKTTDNSNQNQDAVNSADRRINEKSLASGGIKQLSRMKLKIETLKNSNLKDFAVNQQGLEKLDLPTLKKMQNKMSKKSKAYGKNNNALEHYKELLNRGDKLTPEEIKKLQELADQINAEEDALENMSGDRADNSESLEDSKEIEKLAKAIGKTDVTDENEMPLPDKNRVSTKTAAATTDEQDQSAYLENRKQLAAKVDGLLKKDRSNTLKSEQLKLTEFFSRIFETLKRFSVLIGTAIILTIWFSRKKYEQKKQKNREMQNISLPAEVKKQLRDLYKQLVNSKLLPQEEVLRSFYIVEIAMAQIEFPRDEALPPALYLDAIAKQLPSVAKLAEVPIQMFNRLFYGEKAPGTDELSSLRLNMKLLMKKLQVI